MASSFVRAGGLAVGVACSLFAAAFWEQSSPEEWTPEQIEEMLGDSPWARPADVRFTGDRGGSRLPGGVSLPGGRGRSGEPRLPGTRPWPGGGVGFPQAKQARQSAFESEATVVWTSALPIREALARKGIREELRDVRAQDFYVVTIDGLPSAMAHLAEKPESFLQSARLERRGKPAVQATRVELRPRPGAPGVDLYFPRDGELSVGDKTVEVSVSVGDYSIRSKFKLAEMVYRGRLEL